MNPAFPVSAPETVESALSGKVSRLAAQAVGIALLLALAFTSVLVGTRPLAVSTVVDALLAYDSSLPEHIIVRDYRLPRTLLAILCGAAFGVAGALIQAVTRNPLADPGVLGVNAGAAFFVTLAVGLLGLRSVDHYLWFAFLGAVSVALTIYALGAAGRDGASPIRLVLTGVAMSAVLGAVGSSVALLNPKAFDALRFWAIGSVAGRDMSIVATVSPFIAVGLALAVIASRALNSLALGDDLARSLGTNIVWTRVLALIAITLLAGAGTAAAGPIGFVGLMVPHAVRWFTGPDQRWIVSTTIIYAPVLLLAADITGRLVLFPGELETGIVTAFLGAPVLILLARRKATRGL